MKEEKISSLNNDSLDGGITASGIDSGGIDPSFMQDTYNDDLDGFNDDFGGDFKRPISSDVGFDYNCLKSHAKNKIVFFTPVIEEVVVGVPLVDNNNKIVYREVTINGEKQSVPVVRKVKKIKMVVSYDTREENFPISDWFNDSVPSSILNIEEARYIRLLDDLGAKLGRRLAMNPDKVQIMGFLQRLSFQKNSLADTGKAVGGVGVRNLKTVTTKSENANYDYRKDSEDYNEFQDRKEKQKKGLLGMGIKFPLFGTF